MSLTDDLKKSPPARQRGQGRQAFLARRYEIEQAISEGFSSAEVWQHLHDKGVMPIQYRQFARYVDRYILSKQSEVKPTNEPEFATNKESEVKPRKTNEPITKTEEISRRFEHNAKGKSKEDLI